MLGKFATLGNWLEHWRRRIRCILRALSRTGPAAQLLINPLHEALELSRSLCTIRAGRTRLVLRLPERETVHLIVLLVSLLRLSFRVAVRIAQPLRTLLISLRNGQGASGLPAEET